MIARQILQKHCVKTDSRRALCTSQINAQNIPVFVLWIAAGLIGAGILQEGAGMPLPFAVPAALFVVVQLQKMSQTK